MICTENSSISSSLWSEVSAYICTIFMFVWLALILSNIILSETGVKLFTCSAYFILKMTATSCSYLPDELPECSMIVNVAKISFRLTHFIIVIFILFISWIALFRYLYLLLFQNSPPPSEIRLGNLKLRNIFLQVYLQCSGFSLHSNVVDLT